MAESVLGANVVKNDEDLAPMTGSIDPNSVVTGKKGQVYTQVISSTEAEIWICTGGTTWV